MTGWAAERGLLRRLAAAAAGAFLAGPLMAGGAYAAPAAAPAKSAAEAKQTPQSAPLPNPLARAAKRWKVDPNAVTIAVVPVEGTGAPALLHRADTAVSPASTAKLVTTLLALEKLGVNHRWLTGFYTDAEPDAKGKLKGNLYVKGSGDPNFVIEDFEMELSRLYASGVRSIEGDVVIDRSRFDVPDTSENAFDGRGSRPYNVSPDAALINYRNLSFEFLPDTEKGIARIAVFPKMEGVRFPSTIKLSKGACGDWKTKLGFKMETLKDGTKRARFNGTLPSACGAKNFNVIAMKRDEYFERVFRAAWKRAGGTWKGKVREGRVPEEAERRIAHASPALTEVATLTNKWSNNVMARHLFLTVGANRVEREAKEAWEAKLKAEKAEQAKQPKQSKQQAAGQNPSAKEKKAPKMPPVRGATLADARAELSEWLREKGIDPALIHIDNGSGLSRETHVTARAMASLLRAGWASPYMPEYLASLPVTGEDGTMVKRKVAVSEGRIKTGFLTDVRSIGGYVRSMDGRRWAVYASVHGAKNMPGGIAFLDNVILWVRDLGEKPTIEITAETAKKADEARAKKAAEAEAAQEAQGAQEVKQAPEAAEAEETEGTAEAPQK